MTTLAIVLVVLTAVAIAAALARTIPAVPLPLVQIAVGFGIGAGTGLEVRLDPELFFALFLPPLLFLDGLRLPKDEVRRDAAWIVGLATTLVFTTVLAIGWFAHLLLPTMPLAVACALAAVLSPTDPIAVSAIAARIRVPHRMLHILEAESLLNDASGLVCLRFAVLAATAGTFSLGAAVGTFLWAAAAGLAIGAAVVYSVLKGGEIFARRFGADPGWHVLVSLLLPFASYLLAEHVHASGILASVGAGVTMTFASRNPTIGAATRVQGDQVWQFVSLALNGAIFVLLGEQLPLIFGGVGQVEGEPGGWWLPFATVSIFTALFTLRFGWTWTAFAVARARGTASALMRRAELRLVTAFALAGVRGAVTLAAVLTLPFALPDGSPLPARGLAIFIATAVILLSMTAASVGLPLLLRNLRDEGGEADEEREEQDARRLILDAAASALLLRAGDADASPLERDVAEQLAASLTSADGTYDEDAEESRRRRELERTLRRLALTAGRREAVRLVDEGRARSTITQRVVRELDLTELRL